MQVQPNQIFMLFSLISSCALIAIESRRLPIRSEGYARKQLDDGIGDTLVSLRTSPRFTDESFQCKQAGSGGGVIQRYIRYYRPIDFLPRSCVNSNGECEPCCEPIQEKKRRHASFALTMTSIL